MTSSHPSPGGESSKSRKPIKVNKAGGKAMQILPPMSEIPEEFHRSSSPWCRWAAKWFFDGLKRWPVPAEGIDRGLAMANLSSVMSSWEPKHEHKEAGVAYLASLWFTSPDGEEIKEGASS